MKKTKEYINKIRNDNCISKLKLIELYQKYFKDLELDITDDNIFYEFQIVKSIYYNYFPKNSIFYIGKNNTDYYFLLYYYANESTDNINFNNNSAFYILVLNNPEITDCIFSGNGNIYDYNNNKNEIKNIKLIRTNNDLINIFEKI